MIVHSDKRPVRVFKTAGAGNQRRQENCGMLRGGLRQITAALLAVAVAVIIAGCGEKAPSKGQSVPETVEDPAKAAYIVLMSAEEPDESAEGGKMTLYMDPQTGDSIITVVYYGEMGYAAYNFTFNNDLKMAEHAVYNYAEPIYINSQPKISSVQKTTLSTSPAAKKSLTEQFLEYRKKISDKPAVQSGEGGLDVVDIIKKSKIMSSTNFEIHDSVSAVVNDTGGRIFVLLIKDNDSSNGSILVGEYKDSTFTLLDKNDGLLEDIDNGSHDLVHIDGLTFCLQSEYGPNVRSGDLTYFTVGAEGALIDSLTVYRKSFEGEDVFLETAAITKKNFGVLRLKDLPNDIWSKHEIVFKREE